MDPSSVQAFGQFSAQADLNTQVTNLAPLAATWHGVSPGAPAQYTVPTETTSQGVLPAFWGKVEAVGSETGNIAAEAASFVGRTAVNMVEAPYKAAEGVSKLWLDHTEGGSLNAQSQQLSGQLDSLVNSYRTGQISSKEYAAGIKEFTQDSSNLQYDLMNFQSSVQQDKVSFTKAAINTASDVVTVMTLGVASPTIAASEKAAAAELSSASALAQGASVISKLSTDEEAWKAVSPLAQQAVKLATTQVLSAAGKQATAAQISKAVAVNLLLKYPLTYNAFDSTGQQVYAELDNNKYGDAVKTIAFNAALLLSGGPIGWGLKNAAKLAKATSIAAGLRPGSILDELSSRIGNGDRRALAGIAQKLVDNGNESEVKSMVVGLESNLARAGGNPSQAVNLIVDHLENYVSWGSLKNATHQEVWDNITNYFKHAEGLQQLKSEGQIAGMASDDERAVVPGRFAVQDKNAIAAAVSQDGEDGWKAFKTANPNSAAANNVNLDKQITHIIDTIKSPEARNEAIRSIPAQFGLDGVPKDYAKQMAKDGYIAIVPKSHNLPVVPFAETSGKLATSGAEGNFFTKAAAPVPVLRSVGAALTWAGLSPEVASQRVSTVFNQTFTDNLAKSGFSVLQGDTKEQAATDVLQKLSNYMKAPSGGLKVFGHYLPVTDMRQLTTNDVMRALGVSKSEAKDVQDAIMQAHLEVPRQIVGLGTKIMDRNFKYNPMAGAYSRIQGAARFAWNPVFTQGRLPIKAEILAQMQTGGKFPTIAGTNTFMKMFFPGQYKEIDAIATDSSFKKLMPGGFGGEAADSTGFTDTGSKFNINTLRPVAGVVKDMAANMGIDSKTLIEQYPEKVSDAAAALLHYDHNASFVNSPMARTLNMAIFPFRFNVKVSTFMVKFLAKQEPAIQYAAVKGLMNANQYLKSPQGQAWYSQNADAIGLFGYFSPLETISVISNALGLKHDSISQYGELGGLPFGVIPQILDSAGLTHFNQAYVNPKTGAISQNYVPKNMYGAANAAVADLLGALYTFPGATAGLTSKGTIDRTIAGGILPGSASAFNKVAPTNVTPQEQQFSNTVKAANGNTPTTPGPIRSRIPGVNVPVQTSPLTVPNSDKSTKVASAPKKKKADFTPALLPGQTALGQL